MCSGLNWTEPCEDRVQPSWLLHAPPQGQGYLPTNGSGGGGQLEDNARLAVIKY